VVNENGIWKWVKDTKEPSPCILPIAKEKFSETEERRCFN